MIIKLDESTLRTAEALIEKYGLPEIKGVSEKQIQYANDLRNKYLNEAKVAELIEQYDAVQERLKDDHIRTESLKPVADSKFGGNLDEALEYLYKMHGMEIINQIRNESSASKIIDALFCHGKRRI